MKWHVNASTGKNNSCLKHFICFPFLLFLSSLCCSVSAREGNKCTKILQGRLFLWHFRSSWKQDLLEFLQKKKKGKACSTEIPRLMLRWKVWEILKGKLRTYTLIESFITLGCCNLPEDCREERGALSLQVHFTMVTPPGEVQTGH